MRFCGKKDDTLFKNNLSKQWRKSSDETASRQFSSVYAELIK